MNIHFRQDIFSQKPFVYDLLMVSKLYGKFLENVVQATPKIYFFLMVMMIYVYADEHKTRHQKVNMEHKRRKD